jgi:hypothetical protein
LHRVRWEQRRIDAADLRRHVLLKKVYERI